MLERFGIPVIQASVEYPATVYNEPSPPPTPSSPISVSGFQKFREKYHLEEVSESESESEVEEVQPKKKKINL